MRRACGKDGPIHFINVQGNNSCSVLFHGTSLPAFLKIKAKFQGEISTSSSFPCTLFWVLPKQRPYCSGVWALSLRFHWTSWNKRLSSPLPFSEDPTCPLITGGDSLLEWELLLKLLETCSLTTCPQVLNFRKRRVSPSEAQWTLKVLI